MKIALVYYSGTGNTEAMAEIIRSELQGKAEVTVIDPPAFGPEDLRNYDAFAFGCPAMGQEVLEEEIFEPMFASIEGGLNGRKIIIFGSYGWGDGEWMRSWEERCIADGAILTHAPVIANEAPDETAEAELREAAGSLL